MKTNYRSRLRKFWALAATVVAMLSPVAAVADAAHGRVNLGGLSLDFMALEPTAAESSFLFMHERLNARVCSGQICVNEYHTRLTPRPFPLALDIVLGNEELHGQLTNEMSGWLDAQVGLDPRSMIADPLLSGELHALVTLAPMSRLSASLPVELGFENLRQNGYTGRSVWGISVYGLTTVEVSDRIELISSTDASSSISRQLTFSIDNDSAEVLELRFSSLGWMEFSPAPVPEPATFPMLLAGVLFLVAARMWARLRTPLLRSRLAGLLAVCLACPVATATAAQELSIQAMLGSVSIVTDDVQLPGITPMYFYTYAAACDHARADCISRSMDAEAIPVVNSVTSGMAAARATLTNAGWAFIETRFTDIAPLNIQAHASASTWTTLTPPAPWEVATITVPVDVHLFWDPLTLDHMGLSGRFVMYAYGGADQIMQDEFQVDSRSGGDNTAQLLTITLYNPVATSNPIWVSVNGMVWAEALSPVPEATTWSMLCIGLLALLARGRAVQPVFGPGRRMTIKKSRPPLQGSSFR